jgi:hypothetical protein
VFRIALSLVAASVFLVAGCGGGGSKTDPNAQSKPTWTATVTNKASTNVGPSKQAALRVALRVYAEANGPDEHSYKNQCSGGSKPEAGWICFIHGKRCDAWVDVIFNGPHDSVGHPFRLGNNCYPHTRGFYPFYKGCQQRPGCVERAEQLHSFPRNAAIRPEGSLRHPNHGPCGSFVDPFESYWVSVSNRHTTCTTALALAHALHWNMAKTHSLGGGDLFVISGFPGWHCSSGMGFSRCTKGRQQAAWGFQSMIRWAHPNNPNR